MSKLTQLQQDLLWLIPDGSSEPKSAREICGLAHISQRELRKQIRTLRDLGVPIVSGDKGYYLPDLNDPLDVAGLRAYIVRMRAHGNAEIEMAKKVSIWLQTRVGEERMKEA